MASKSIKVAVTGNAPFLEWDFNTSLMVRDALPHVIKRDGKSDIRLMKYARVTHDTYDDVRQVSQEIWTGQPGLFMPNPDPCDDDPKLDISFILHLGMEIRKEEFNFETAARRDGYEKPGEDGKYVDSKQLQRLGLPPVLSTGFDVGAAWKKVKSQFPDVSIRVSDDAGMYFCELRLYSSLAEAELHHPDKRGRVVFTHVPQTHDDEAIKLASAVTVAYIEALADDEILA